jgi:predicted O-methyltransferase YrrM
MEQSGIPCTLTEPKVKAVLDRLHRDAKGDELRSGWKLLPYLVQKLLGRNPSFTDQYHRMADLGIPISAEQGTFAYLVARSIGARRIVEFGTSFGVSTIYLASAVRDNGGGTVIGSEFIDSKAERAKANIEEAGLTNCVEVRIGDAMETLADPGGAVDLLLIDGSKDLYLPILKLLAPHLRQGAVVLADNVLTPFVRKTLSEYVAYMQDSRHGFCSVTVPFHDGFEYSIKM